MDETEPKIVIQLYKGLFTQYADAMFDAKQDNYTIVSEWFENSLDSPRMSVVAEVLFHSMMKKGRGRFDPILVKKFIEMELLS